MYPEDGPRSTVDVLSHDASAPVVDQSRHRPVRRPTPPRQRIGYARTKSDQDDLHQAVMELRRVGVESALVFIDRGSRCRGKDRDELQSAIAAAGPGDRLVVASLARLARSHHDLAAIIDALQQRGVTLEVAGHAFDEISSIDMVRLSAQFKADLITDVVAEHNQYMSLRNARGGQPTLPPMTWLHLRELFDSGMPRHGLAALFKISKPNVFRIAGKPASDVPGTALDRDGTSPREGTAGQCGGAVTS